MNWLDSDTVRAALITGLGGVIVAFIGWWKRPLPVRPDPDGSLPVKFTPETDAAIKRMEEAAEKNLRASSEITGRLSEMQRQIERAHALVGPVSVLQHQVGEMRGIMDEMKGQIDSLLPLAHDIQVQSHSAKHGVKALMQRNVMIDSPVVEELKKRIADRSNDSIVPE